MSLPLVIGRGSHLTGAILPPGSSVEIIPQAITLSAAEPIGATTLAVAPLTQPLTASVAAPLYLTFSDAVDGGDRPVIITASAAIGATSLTCLPLHAPISNNSIAPFPVVLQARTSAGITTSANDVTTTTFETGFFEDGIVSRVGLTLDAPGNYLPTDSGYKTVQDAFYRPSNIWLSLFLPIPGGYTTGQVYKGVASVTKCDIKDDAGGIIALDMTFKFRGAPIITYPS